MKLTIGERFVLLSLIPQQGNFATLKIVRELQDNLSFSEEEHKKHQFVFEGENVSWKGSSEKEINFGEKATDIIVKAFKELNAQEKLKLEHMPLYEKFVGE